MQLSLFDQRRDAVSVQDSNDYHVLPVTEKQLRFARQLATRTSTELPAEVQGNRRLLSQWIDAHARRTSPRASAFSNYPSSKQVAFAERLARVKRRDIPQACFRDRVLMSKWIDTVR
ncbi:MAG: hypothetical protein AAGB10_12210 [Pseudomonadota bacterium]